MSDDEKKLLAYRYLTTFGKKPEGPEIEAVAKKTGLDDKVVAGMVGAAMRFPAAYNQLTEAKYAESQIPDWIKRPEVSTPKEVAVEVPAPTYVASKVLEPPAETVVALPALGDLDLEEKPQSTGGVELAEPEQPKYAEGDEEPEGEEEPEDNLKGVYQQEDLERQLKRQDIMRLADGTYVQARPDGTGRVEIVPVDTSQIERLKSDVGSTISRLTSNALEVQMDSLVKKVGLNPTVFQSFAWCMAKRDENTGDPYFPENYDIGDFINYCVKFTMKWGFGAEVGMRVGGPSLLTRLQGGQGGNFQVV